MRSSRGPAPGAARARARVWDGEAVAGGAKRMGLAGGHEGK